ncbi:MAG: cache domain-containing protein, partial [Candidatus Omnitrophica bacterium]|nr:cache domain-containing protein [Candidatus Omnitrophota bacterium]
MKKINPSQLFFIASAFLCLASFFFISLTLYAHLKYKHSVVQQAKKIVQSEADRTVKEIEMQLQRASVVAEALQADLSAGKLNDNELAERLKDAIAADPNIVEGGIVWTATTPLQSPERQAARYERKEGKISAMQDNTPGNYTGQEWYDRSLEGKTGWAEPSLDKTTKTYTMIFSLPVYLPETEKKPVGILYIRMSLAWLKDKMNTLKLEQRDFGIILSKKGTLLYHPMSDRISRQTTIFKLLESTKSKNKNYEKQRMIMQKAVNGESGDGYNVARTGESFWYFYRPVRSAGWSVVINFTKNAVPLNGKILRQQQIRIALGLIIFIISLFITFFRLYDVEKFNTHKFWWLSGIFSLLCIIATCFIWYLNLSIPLSEYQQNKIVIDDAVSLNNFLASDAIASQDLPIKEPARIPTGIYIQSLEFATSNNIEISGYVWQRYTKGLHDNIARGFIMPEAKALTMNEVYRQENKNEEVIGWRFQTTIRQVLDYAKYPFDHPNISVWLRPNDFTHNVILVPDLEGYRLANASALPGLQSRLALPGYAFTGTFFSYEPKIINANFG